MKGGAHQIYLRKRGKEAPPADWHLKEKPVLEVDNDSFKTGPRRYDGNYHRCQLF